MDLDNAKDAQHRILTEVFGFTEVAMSDGRGRFVRAGDTKEVDRNAPEVVSSFAAADRAESTSLAARARGTWRPEDDIAIGLTQNEDGGYRLAALYQRPGLDQHELVDKLRATYKGEIDVRYIGRTRARWMRTRHDPLIPGLSVGHPDITAGTLGAFARDRTTGTLGILSNNHVLADVNAASLGDAALQPGRLDGGTAAERVGSLDRFVPLDFVASNRVDCAWAALETGRGMDLATIRDSAGARLGQLSQADPIALGLRDSVQKIGRTTGHTFGVVTAINVLNLQVDFDGAVATFDGVAQIETTGRDAFSDGGDSGSLILDEDFRPGGLLFAGSLSGGTGNKGLTFSCELRTVLDALELDLAI